MPARRIEKIQSDLRSFLVCSNLNRVCILRLLKSSPNSEMQAEELSMRLGLSHRTVLYHLSVLEDHELVEVRRFRTRGQVRMRSVWGLRDDPSTEPVFSRIGRDFSPRQLDRFLARAMAHA